MADKYTSKIKAFQDFIGKDCCETGREYHKLSVTEFKEFKDSCTPEEMAGFYDYALKHMNSH